MLLLHLGAGAIGVRARTRELSPEDLEKIRAVNEAYGAAWLKNDAAAVMSLFTNDAVLIPQGSRPVEGADAIKRFWWPAGGPRTTIKTFNITTDEIGGGTDAAYVRGTYKFSFSYEEKGKTLDLTNTGNYIMIMKRQQGGAWLISHRMWGDLPR